MEIETGFHAYMSLRTDKLPISQNNFVGENTVLQLNILNTGVLTLVVEKSSHEFSLQNVSVDNLLFLVRIRCSGDENL